MSDIPRDANGWSTVSPRHFTLEQLISEAEQWRGSGAGRVGTVAAHYWGLYTRELIARGFIDETDVRRWVRDGPPKIFRHATMGKWVTEWQEATL